jgi:N-acetyl-alpha-D-glucosaminyl L-malate synthase BshA
VRIGITCYPTYGGSGIVATELGLELANRGHEVHFITYASPIRLDPGHPRICYHEVEVPNYPLFQFPPYTLALASQMATVAERHSLDLLHVHYAIPHSISALLAQQMAAPRRLPFVTTLHGTDINFVGAEPSYFGITKFSIEKSDRVTAVSEYLRSSTVEVFGITRDIRVITNFVNSEMYRPAAKGKAACPFAPPGAKVLMHLSNFRPIKRTQDCVRILAEVVRQTPAHLVMVGDGPDRGADEELAHDLGVEQHVSFVGKQDHVERLLPSATVMLQPSQLESFGLAVLEGMACGVPPVATRVGGVAELISHGSDGFLEDVGDISAQAARVVELLTDATLYERIAAAARYTAISRFCASKVVPKYEELYRQVCGR